MGNRAAALALSLSLCLPSGALAQVPEPGEPAARFVAQVSEAFFDLLPTENHAQARAFFEPELAEMLTPAAWETTRERLLAEAGTIPRYRAHGLSFYPQAEVLLAAVDFSGTGRDGAVICGYLVWSMPSADRIGLMRIEQSVARPGIMRQMEPEAAARTLLSWRCPPDVIEDILGLSKAQ